MTAATWTAIPRSPSSMRVPGPTCMIRRVADGRIADFVTDLRVLPLDWPLRQECIHHLRCANAAAVTNPEMMVEMINSGELPSLT